MACDFTVVTTTCQVSPKIGLLFEAYSKVHILSTNCDMFSSELFDARKLGIGVYD